MLTELDFSCEELAKKIGGTIIGSPEIRITGLNRIEDAKEGELSFLANPKYEKFLKTTGASCLIVPESMKYQPRDNQAFISVKDPYKAFVKIIKFIDNLRPLLSSFIHPTAIIEEDCRIAPTAYVGPYCIIGKNSTIGENVILHSRIKLYDNVTLGDGTVLHSNVVCFYDIVIGKNCIIHAGAVIGDDGFGYIENKDGSYEKIPQLGNVVIEDEVEIGTNSTIDRAMVGSTVIESGVKIDNLVHIAHNVRVGKNTAMAAQSGVSGSAKVGKRNRFGGQVGLAGHLETTDDVVLLAQSGVAKSVNERGVYFGSPIKDRIKAFKIESSLQELPELVKEFHQLKKRITDKFGLSDFSDKF